MQSPKIYNYLKLINNDTQYAKKMARLSNKIFGNVSRPTDPSSMRVVRVLSEQPIYKRDFFVNWYPRHVETHKLVMNLRDYGLYRDEHEDFREEMNRLRALRGKAKGWKRDRQVKDKE